MKSILEKRIEGDDGAEVHRIHIVEGSRENLPHDDFVGPFGRMEWIPKCIHLSVRTQIRQLRAQPKPVVRPLPAAGYLGCHKSERLRITDEVLVCELRVGRDEHVPAHLRVEVQQHLRQLRVEEPRRALELHRALPVRAPLC